MRLAEALDFALKHGSDTLATAGDVGTAAAAVLADGKVEPGEVVDAAESVALKTLHRFDAAGKAIVTVPIDTASQAAKIHNAVEAIREEAVKKLSDRKLTAQEAVELAAYAARRILQAIPSHTAQ